ncbi:hypothetical protein CNBM2280 [Cryptococcus deneoformans B-3501A]|uniref:hypothetical protein n=1 Tax=Cryptococcus deneoformans (strain B-3501A) TaxID=283643 RepID=UPI000042F480|nr:hypothetical protein CNBM2280 [Cryptococcus neoformans var. neoformans B-3501A]EAL17424.1 hypothetical protein CNBM2280 [Cryptococcus neoformans var. neoformans B-3501A]
MADSMTLALEHKINNPVKAIRKLQIYTGSQSHPSTTPAYTRPIRPRPLDTSIVQEEELVKKINEYAERDTLLTPRYVVEIAGAVCDGELGVNWGSRFFQRHGDTIHSRFSLTKSSDVYKQTFQRRAEPFTTLYVKEVYGTGLYAPHLIFNMDEVAFELSSSRALEECGELRLVAIQRMAKLYHRQMSTSHLRTTARKLVQGAGGGRQVVRQGWINSYVMLKWLEDAFDPYTRDIANSGRDRRLLIHDGAESHTKVDFLEACWARNIVVILLPAKMSGRFQPLDVDFFNTLKAAYHRQLDEYQLGSSLRGVAKGMFWGMCNATSVRHPHNCNPNQPVSWLLLSSSMQQTSITTDLSLLATAPSYKQSQKAVYNIVMHTWYSLSTFVQTVSESSVQDSDEERSESYKREIYSRV